MRVSGTLVSSSVEALWPAALGALLSGSTVIVIVAVGALALRLLVSGSSVSAKVKVSTPVKPLVGV